MLDVSLEYCPWPVIAPGPKHHYVPSQIAREAISQQPLAVNDLEIWTLEGLLSSLPYSRDSRTGGSVRLL